MPLRSKHEQVVIYIDQQVNHILSNEGDHIDLLLSLANIMEDVKKLMDSVTEEEMETYCQNYDGFYRFMQVVEELAWEISQSSSPTYH